MAELVNDMTKGRPAGLILRFALPLMIGNIFQQLYTTVDAIVVGKGVGVEALAALGSAEWPNWLVTGLVIGFTQGFSVRISQRFGAEDWKGLRKMTAMSVWLALGIAIAATAVSLICSRPMLLALKTDPAVLEQALSYLRVLFSGIPVIMGVTKLKSPASPSAAGSRVSGLRTITRLYTGTWKCPSRQRRYKILCSTEL